MLESLDDVAQTLMTVWVRVSRPDLVGDGRNDQEGGAFEQYCFFSTRLGQKSFEVALHDIEVWNEGMSDAACRVCHISVSFLRRKSLKSLGNENELGGKRAR